MTTPWPTGSETRTAPASAGTPSARRLDGLPGGRGLNIAHEAVDRHAAGPRADHVALRWLGKRRCVARRAPTRELGAAHQPVRATCSSARGRAGRAGLRARRAGSPSSTSRRSARSSTAAWSARCSRPSGPSPSASAWRSATARVLVTTPALYRRKVAGHPRRAAGPRARRSSSASRRADRARRRPRRAAGAAPTHLRDPADRPRGPGAAALHQRHDGHAQGRGPRPRARSSPTTPPAASPSTCTPTTCSGAPPTPAG